MPAGVRGSHEHCSAGLVALVEQLTCIDLVRDARLDVGGDIPINVFKRDGIDAELVEELLFQVFRIVVQFEQVRVGAHVRRRNAECNLAALSDVGSAPFAGVDGASNVNKPSLGWT